MASKETTDDTTTDTTPAPITDEQYQAALQLTAAYERAKQEAIAAQRAAYGEAVTAFVADASVKEVYAMLVHMVDNYTDDSYFGMPVGALRTILRNLATQVNVDLDIAPTVETTAPDTSA